MLKFKYLIISLFFIFSNLSAYDLIVFSGAGLIKPVSEIIEIFEKENKVDIEVSFDGSGALYGKYMSGFPCDVIILGGKVMQNMQYEAIIDNDSYQEVIYHTPVIITSPNNKSINKLKDLENENIKLALGSKKGPVIGELSYRIFEKNNLIIKEENIIVQTPTVNQLVLYVINNSVDASIVWENNAKISQKQNKIKIINIPKKENIVEIVPSAIMKKAENKKLAYLFNKFIKSNKAKKIWEKWGYEVIK